MRLIDYDGMCVPALTLLKSGRGGPPAYQHPQRLREGIYSLEVDRFPHLVIYTALRGLIVGGRSLWDKYDNGDNLLFKPADFEAPEKSEVFAELLKVNDTALRKLVEQLAESARQPLDRTPLLADLVQESPAVTVPAATPTRTAPPVAAFASLTEADASRPVRRSAGPATGKLPIWAWAAGGVALLALVVGGVVLAMSRKKAPEAPGPQVVAQVNTGQAPSVPANPGPREPAPPPVQPMKPVVQVPPPVMPADAAGPGRFVGHNSPIASLAISADGRRLVSGSHDYTVRLWDVESGKELRRFVGHTALVSSVALSPDGRRVVSGSGDQTARLWDVESGKQIYRLDQTAAVSSVAFSPDGRQATSTGGIRKVIDRKIVWDDCSVRLWDVQSGQEIRRCEGHRSLVTQAIFTSDGRRILSSSQDATVRLWDVETGRQIREYPAGGSVNGVAVSPDGHYALSASNANNMKLWDVETGQQLRLFSDFRARSIRWRFLQTGTSAWVPAKRLCSCMT